MACAKWINDAIPHCCCSSSGCYCVIWIFSTIPRFRYGGNFSRGGMPPSDCDCHHPSGAPRSRLQVSLWLVDFACYGRVPVKYVIMGVVLGAMISLLVDLSRRLVLLPIICKAHLQSSFSSARSDAHRRSRLTLLPCT